MAASKFHHHHHHQYQRPKFLYLGGGDRRINPSVDSDSFDQINESDLWTTGVEDHAIENEPQNLISRRSKIPLKSHHQRKVPMTTATARSLPVNVPDWSKILRDEYTDHGMRENDHDYEVGFDDLDDDDDDDERLPPHEYLARTRIASFSVHEGVGRTLKGRDLSRVRNAIWKQTGFEQD